MTELEARAMRERMYPLAGNLTSATGLFYEFLREWEFDLALHLICDELIERSDPVDTALIDELDNLHREMRLEDDCVELLRIAGTTVPRDPSKSV